MSTHETSIPAPTLEDAIHELTVIIEDSTRAAKWSTEEGQAKFAHRIACCWTLLIHHRGPPVFPELYPPGIMGAASPGETERQ